ncbi:hypothetical protein SRB5_15000 [Streptomyces sp. RB5]|uniref:DUF4132 domain-containing protein n=1 Tax=Streptomyces smaragdinus TaxID=2585196 RepID=A0A7K0CF41_9ACTN|nr:DUF4132 domain-containing protein [Streptomyces smaragdinus]MQY11384.1 hypothetical protein [Streptomyces smaragdinus]
MLYESLVAQARRNDEFDVVRLGALEQVRWLVELLERQRKENAQRSWVPDEESNGRQEAVREATRAELTARLAACSDDEGRAAVICLMLAAYRDAISIWQFDQDVRPLLPRLRGWTSAEISVLLLDILRHDSGYWVAHAMRWALRAAEHLDADGLRATAPWLRHTHTEVMARDVGVPERRALASHLRALLAGVDAALIPEGLIPAHTPWAAPLRKQAETSPTRELADCLRHLSSLSSPRPTQKWRRACLDLTDAASIRELLPDVLRELAVGEPTRIEGTYGRYSVVVDESDSDLARGLIWACTLTGGGGPDTAPHLAALALRTGDYRSGSRQNLVVAGAAINALAETDGPAALESLWKLRTAIRDRALRKQIDTALRTAAARQGITPEQLVERSVPDHGLNPDGSLERTLGEHRVRIAIEGPVTVRLTFTGPNKRTSRTAPAAVKNGHEDGLRELKAVAKEIRATLSGERARLEGLMSQDGRVWPYDEWRRHYRDHPVTGTLTRALIWEFEGGDGTWRAALPGDADDEARRVRLWHPVRASVEDITAWRERVVAEELRQPFKQAFREIYLLTPAEEETREYSNRFAAHIVHYQQLYALLKERGWQAEYLGHYIEGAARGEFGGGEWRAWFDHVAMENRTSYEVAYASTDRVRFERRAGKGWRDTPLAEVPAMVFSEVMRDVDLFVGVTSIAADPEWTDQGDDPYGRYWRTAVFGELTASAEIRREALGRILPRLRIAGRCELRGRYLRVVGELGTYRIHLGSGNVLMEPDDAYLCIVPASGRRATGVFLPFEDDRLSLILSKAMLLAGDDRITDMSILRQIRRAAPAG